MDKYFKKYRRTQIAEIRDLLPHENPTILWRNNISVSPEDYELSPKNFAKGKIARNPENHNDQWYIAYDYFYYNFERNEL